MLSHNREIHRLNPVKSPGRDQFKNLSRKSLCDSENKPVKFPGGFAKILLE